MVTDTDSLTYIIETDDLYDDMKRDTDVFDFSEYDKNHKCFNISNKKVVGKFKCETNGLIIIEFVGLRSKMYSIKLEDLTEKKTGKGIKKCILKRNIHHNNYYDCLFSDKQEDKKQMVAFNTIRSVKHNISTVRLNKVGLSCYDDKRYLLDDGVTSYSYGHKNI